MIQQLYTFKDVVSGDTQDEVSFEMSKNSAPMDLTGCTIRMDFLKSNGEIAQSFSTVNESIIITNAASGFFKIPDWKCIMPPSTYQGDIEFKFPDGKVKSYIRTTQKVLLEYTK